MSRLSFEIDWVDAEGVNGPELSATWASLRILAGESVVTRVLDTRAKTVREFVYVPLYPLAEWLVTNWWFLTRELGSPAKERDPDFRRRHALGANREGYAFPKLGVVPSGTQTRVVWKRGHSPWTNIEFLGEGQIWMDSVEFRETCADLIYTVIQRLASLGVDETFLQEEWNAIQGTDEEESRFCETAAGLGWDPYALDDTKHFWIARVEEQLGDLLDEALPALDANRPATCFNIANAIERAKRNDLPLKRFRFLCDETRRDAETELDDPHLERLRLLRDDFQAEAAKERNPWNAGYALAQRLRQSLDLDGGPLPTLKDLSEAIGEDPKSLRKVTRPAGCFAGTPMIDGVVTRNADENPAFAFRHRGDDARRFHFCRALAEVLISPGSDALLTRAFSERQQRNRAFAAEFLAPSSGLRTRVSGPVVDGEDIDELAVEFGVSSQVIEHQIANHRIAEILRTGTSDW